LISSILIGLAYGLFSVFLMYVCFKFLFVKFSGEKGSVKLFYLGWFISIVFNCFFFIYFSKYFFKTIMNINSENSSDTAGLVSAFCLLGSGIFWIRRLIAWQNANKDKIREANRR
jgi:hypothetical protein